MERVEKALEMGIYELCQTLREGLSHEHANRN